MAPPIAVTLCLSALFVLWHGVDAACIASQSWTQRVLLNPAAEYTLDYKVDTTTSRLTIGLRAKTTGWLGFGLSESGHMVGSDIVTGAVVNGAPRMEDRFGQWDAYPFEGAIPKEDKCNSWRVECALEENGYTEMVLSRPLVTQDTEDRPIIDGDMFVIYAWGLSDTLAYHSSRRGTTVINFFRSTLPMYTPPSDADGTIDVVLNNYVTTEEVTQYVLQRFDVGPQVRQIVGIEPLVRDEDRGFTHHILVHECGLKETEAPLLFLQTGAPINAGLISPLGLGACMGLVTGWSQGGLPRNMPDVAGYKIGDGAARWLVLEIHVDNPNALAGRTIASGIRLHTTTHLRANDVGTLVLGDAQVRFSSIPAGQPMVHYESTCPSDCLRTFGGDITIFHSFPHMHSFGREIWTMKYSATGEATQISHKQFWSFAHQTQVSGLNVKITATDKISTHCVYDTTKTPTDVKFGSLSYDEMCMDFVAYYPKQNAGLHCGYRSSTSTLCRNAVVLNNVPNPQPDGLTSLPLSIALGMEPAQCNTVIEATHAPDSQQDTTASPTAAVPPPTVPAATARPTQQPSAATTTLQPSSAVTLQPSESTTPSPTAPADSTNSPSESPDDSTTPSPTQPIAIDTASPTRSAAQRGVVGAWGTLLTLLATTLVSLALI